MGLYPVEQLTGVGAAGLTQFGMEHDAVPPRAQTWVKVEIPGNPELAARPFARPRAATIEDGYE